MPFINDNFLLLSDAAKELYHDHAAELPIIDYHCHLPPEEIAEDTRYRNLTHIWLDGDHYKWRALRSCGVEEALITGDASDRQKFMAWAETVPKTLRNPLYHWTHMELKNPFGITRLLNGESAAKIWDECNEMLQEPEFSARALVRRNRVSVVATTDDPTDSLEHHERIRKEGDIGFLVVPTFRPDRGMEIENGEAFRRWIERLEAASNIDISTFADLLDALRSRHDAFDRLGCRASDHGIARPHAASFTELAVSQIFDAAMAGKSVSDADAERFKSAFLYHCGRMNHEKEWVFQLHIGALRNNNTRMMKRLGRDAGYDSIGDSVVAAPLAKLLDLLDREDRLPRTVLYNINPRDNELFGAMIGNFQDGRIPGKLQHGPPWWFLDQKDGIERQLDSLSNMGILSEFIGMTTDSRSFLSWPRHDYFRRIVCNVIGKDMEEGLLPDEPELMAGLIRKICHENAETYFRFGQGAR